jgi:septum formation protein
MKQLRPLVLASGSPRRRDILHNLRLAFTVEVADVDETRLAGEAPDVYVARLAALKATTVAARHPHAAAVLGADTTVVHAGEVLNKPSARPEGARMLDRLRGHEHSVLTAVAIVLMPERSARGITVSTRVRFRDFDDATLDGYVASGEGMDKAGAYGIQELGAALVSEVHGSYTNVVGLPASETIELLTSLGVIADWP